MEQGSPKEPWPAKVSDLQFVKRLGHGYFGEVWECRRIVAGAAAPGSVAVKKVPLSKVRQHHLTEQMEREVDILRSLKHPRIVRLFFDFRDEKHIYLGMEFAEGGGLFELLTKSPGQRLSLELSAQFFYEVCDALEYLHGLPEKVIHRDIKPENILLDRERHAKLADFGWSNLLEGHDLRTTFCGTPDYLAPEMIRGEGHDEKLDMWEMGVLLYEMVVGKSPFGAEKQEITCKLILQCAPRFPADTDADAKDLIMRLCRLKPEERLTAAQAKQHPFVLKHYGGLVATGQLSEDAILSVQARKLHKTKIVLEGEMTRALQEKSALENELLQRSMELDDKHEELKREQKAREKAQAEKARLAARREEQLREIAELRQAAKK